MENNKNKKKTLTISGNFEKKAYTFPNKQPGKKTFNVYKK